MCDCFHLLTKNVGLLMWMCLWASVWVYASNSNIFVPSWKLLHECLNKKKSGMWTVPAPNKLSGLFYSFIVILTSHIFNEHFHWDFTDKPTKLFFSFFIFRFTLSLSFSPPVSLILSFAHSLSFIKLSST